jgi:hypothetical protein
MVLGWPGVSGMPPRMQSMCAPKQARVLLTESTGG